jgi:hypothetical protein
MIIRNPTGSSALLFKTADIPLTADCPRSTAHLIEPLTYFYLVGGEKTDNQTKLNKFRAEKSLNFI